MRHTASLRFFEGPSTADKATSVLNRLASRVFTGLVLFALFFCFTAETQAQQKRKKKGGVQKLIQRLRQEATMHKNLPYARVGSRVLKLNLAVPKRSARPTPLVVWIHGGGWVGGSKDNRSPAAPFLLRGYAVASIEYRFADVAPFPAQIHDCKAAVRWLRANAAKYNLDSDRFAAWGSSAGGHLASLLGTSGGHQELEGAVGRHLDVPSRVQVVCNYFGPTAFKLPSQQPEGTKKPSAKDIRAFEKLLGGPISEKESLLAMMSPISHVSPDDPPVLIVQGDRDSRLSVSHSRGFCDRLKENGVNAQLVVLPGAGHGGKPFMNPKVLQRVAAFFDASW